MRNARGLHKNTLETFLTVLEDVMTFTSVLVLSACGESDVNSQVSPRSRTP